MTMTSAGFFLFLLKRDFFSLAFLSRVCVIMPNYKLPKAKIVEKYLTGYVRVHTLIGNSTLSCWQFRFWHFVVRNFRLRQNNVRCTGKSCERKWIWPAVYTKGKKSTNLRPVQKQNPGSRTGKPTLVTETFLCTH
jgi:hypothetical protein